MWYLKNYRWGIGIDTFGPKAHEISNVYKLGFHAWKSETEGIIYITIVYCKTKRIMLFFPYKKETNDNCCG